MGETKDKAGTPVVFVSYSHDSPQHKQWVAELASRLQREGGADVILDQWDTELGDDLAAFLDHASSSAAPSR